MDVNGITSAVSSYKNNYENKSETKVAEKSEAKQHSLDETGVVYEPSKATEEAVTKTRKYTPNTELIEKLKADADARTQQLRDIVEKLILGQGSSLGQTDDIWSFLRTGNFTVDAATKAQALEDISEDGYWGVKQTSDRIIDFAKALTGGDPSKAEAMRKAFKEGFELATKTWGDKLPEISQKTYEAVMSKFDEWAAEADAEEA